MHSDRIDRESDSPPAIAASIAPRSADCLDESLELERAVEYVLDDCFFAVGQIVGMRTTVDYEAVAWWRDRFRAKFLAAMRRHGNRWLQDRHNVTTVGWMLAERAVRYAGSGSIGVEAARKAGADVERYCTLHATRRVSTLGLSQSPDVAAPAIAGYWCTEIPLGGAGLPVSRPTCAPSCLGDGTGLAKVVAAPAGEDAPLADAG
jgi:hypothetical protein